MNDQENELSKDADKAFEEESKSNMHFWIPSQNDPEEVAYWKKIWIMGATKVLKEKDEEIKFLIGQLTTGGYWIASRATKNRIDELFKKYGYD